MMLLMRRRVVVEKRLVFLSTIITAVFGTILVTPPTALNQLCHRPAPLQPPLLPPPMKEKQRLKELTISVQDWLNNSPELIPLEFAFTIL